MANDGSYQLDLDNSLTKYRLGFPCKYLAVSGNSTGQALAYVDSNWNVPILLYPGYSGLVNAKESLYVDVGPQPGKMLQLFFGDEPIISSPAAKFSSDAPIALLTYNNLVNSANTGTNIVTFNNNINGIKINGGVVGVLVKSGVAGNNAYGTTSLKLTDSSGTDLVYLANITQIDNISINGGQRASIIIPQLYIPPNVNLRFDTIFGGPVNTITIHTIFLNYQLL